MPPLSRLFRAHGIFIRLHARVLSHRARLRISASRALLYHVGMRIRATLAQRHASLFAHHIARIRSGAHRHARVCIKRIVASAHRASLCSSSLNDGDE